MWALTDGERDTLATQAPASDRTEVAQPVEVVGSTHIARESPWSEVPDSSSAGRGNWNKPINDSTFAWMVGVLKDAGHADMLVEVEQTHAVFLQQPDEPAWTRPKEAQLRQFFGISASKSLQLTSVVCSMAGCEVQAQLFEPDELNRQLQPREPHPTAEVRPVGPGLTLKVKLRTPGMTPVLFYLWYEREDPSTP